MQRHGPGGTMAHGRVRWTEPCVEFRPACLVSPSQEAGHRQALRSSVCKVNSGWPRSGWPQVGHFDQKIKVNQIASYCAMLYPRYCGLWPCTFLGLHSSAFDSSAGQTRGSHFNFYWGTDTTISSYVHLLCSCVTKIDFYHLLWNWQVKRRIKQHKENKQKCVFLNLKISLNMWQAIHSLGWPRSGWSLSFTLCYNFYHRGKSSPKSSVTLWNDGI